MALIALNSAALGDDADKPPVIDYLRSDKISPQDTGSIITWTVKANDPDGDPILYKFFLNDKPMTDWNTNNIWIWETTEPDLESNRIEVQAIDGKHADLSGFDDMKSAQYILNRDATLSQEVISTPSNNSESTQTKTASLVSVPPMMENKADQFETTTTSEANMTPVSSSSELKEPIQIPSDLDLQSPEMSVSSSGDMTSFLNQGNALYNQGRHEEAIQAYDMAIELDPLNPDAWQSKGYALNKLGRNREANDCFWKATGLKAGFATDRVQWTLNPQSNKGRLEGTSMAYVLSRARSKISSEATALNPYA